MTSHDELARRLRNAYSSGAVMPLRDGLAPVDAEGAYAVQEINTRFWQARGPGQPLHAYRWAGAFTADLFVLAVNEFCQTLAQPTVLVLDNASIHQAHVVRAYHAG